MSLATATPPCERAVTFMISGERYGVSVDRVQEVQRIVAFAGAPTHSKSVVGMVNVRGAIVPVIDMRVVAGVEAPALTAETPMLICLADEQLVALIVDEVEDVRSLPDARIRRVPRLHPLAGQTLGTCRCDDSLVYLLDVDAVVARAGACEVA